MPLKNITEVSNVKSTLFADDTDLSFPAKSVFNLKKG